MKNPKLIMKELLSIALLAVLSFVISGYFDLLERFIEYSHEHEDWELDEILITSVVIALVLLVKTIKSSQDLRLEIEFQKISEKKIQELAFQDTLTNFPNRRIFMSKLSLLLNKEPKITLYKRSFLLI